MTGRLAAPHFIQANFFPEHWVPSAGSGPPDAGEQQCPSQHWDLTVAVAHVPVAGRVPWRWSKESAPGLLSSRKERDVRSSALGCVG